METQPRFINNRLFYGYPDSVLSTMNRRVRDEAEVITVADIRAMMRLIKQREERQAFEFATEEPFHIDLALTFSVSPCPVHNFA